METGSGSVKAARWNCKRDKVLSVKLWNSLDKASANYYHIYCCSQDCRKCGSVGIGRRARLRILCLLQACGFKSHLPHDIEEPGAYGPGSFSLCVTGTWTQGFKVSSPHERGSSVGSAGIKGPQDLFPASPHLPHDIKRTVWCAFFYCQIWLILNNIFSNIK